MVMLVKCPGCAVALHVPKRAAGHWARCPACRSTFVVPRDEELIDETASVWIEQSVQDERRRRHALSAIRMARRMHQLMAATTVPSGAPAQARAGGELTEDRDGGGVPDEQVRTDEQRIGEIDEGPPAQTMSDSTLPDMTELDDPSDGQRPTLSDSQVMLSPEQDLPGHQGLTAAPTPLAPPQRPFAAEEDREDGGVQEAPDTEAAPALQEGGQTPARFGHAQEEAAAPSVRGDADGAPAAPDSPDASPGTLLCAGMGVSLAEPPLRIGHTDQPLKYPTQLGGPARPYLVVTEATQAGVTLAFDSMWMEHPRFRASLPLQCVLSNITEPAELLARPLAFIDRSQAQVRSQQALEARYEFPVHEYQMVEDLMNIMGRIEDLPSPFHLPMPYYIGRPFARDTIQTWTRKRRDGRIECYVRIPSARCAMAWVARVNGICGDEYELLAEQVVLSENSAWRDLPEQVRKRLCVWCTFEPGERFICYIPDADFSSRDAGLAGIAVTDRRVVHHKYHHNAQARHEEPVTLYARQGERVTTLILARDTDRARFGKVLNENLKNLLEALAPDCRIKAVISSEQQK